MTAHRRGPVSLMFVSSAIRACNEHSYSRTNVAVPLHLTTGPGRRVTFPHLAVPNKARLALVSDMLLCPPIIIFAAIRCHSRSAIRQSLLMAKTITGMRHADRDRVVIHIDIFNRSRRVVITAHCRELTAAGQGQTRRW